MARIATGHTPNPGTSHVRCRCGHNIEYTKSDVTVNKNPQGSSMFQYSDSRQNFTRMFFNCPSCRQTINL